MAFKEVNGIISETKRDTLVGFLKASLILIAILLTTSGYLLRVVINNSEKCSVEKTAIQVQAAAELKAVNAAHSADMERYNEVLRDLIFQVNDLKQKANENKQK